MYRNKDNRPSVINGQRISHGHTVRDEAKRLRLVELFNKIDPEVESPVAATTEDKPTEKQSIADEYTDVYACSEVKSPQGGLKLRFTRVSSGTVSDSQSTPKQKQQC